MSRASLDLLFPAVFQLLSLTLTNVQKPSGTQHDRLMMSRNISFYTDVATDFSNSSVYSSHSANTQFRIRPLFSPVQPTDQKF